MVSQLSNLYINVEKLRSIRKKKCVDCLFTKKLGKRKGNTMVENGLLSFYLRTVSRKINK